MTTKDQMKVQKIETDIIRLFGKGTQVKTAKSGKELAQKLIAKYGVENAALIVRECMMAPGDVMKRMGYKQWKNSISAIDFFVGANLNDQAVAAAIKKTEAFVKQNKPKAQTAAKTATPKPTKPAPKQKEALKKKKVTLYNGLSVEVLDFPTAQTSAPNYTQNASFTVSTPTKPAPKVAAQQDFPYTPSSQKPAKPASLDERVEAEIARLKKENPNGITLSVLKEKGFDIKKIIGKEDFKHLKSGVDGTAFGQAVRDSMKLVHGSGECAQAVRRGLAKWGKDKPDLDYPEDSSSFYAKRCAGSNAACNMWKAFENDRFLVLTYPSNPTGNPELKNVPNGTTVFFSRHPAKYKKSDSHPGHVATHHNGQYCQGNSAQSLEKISGSGYAAYGKTYTMAFPMDTQADDELVRKIVRQKMLEDDRIRAHQNQAQGR